MKKTRYIFLILFIAFAMVSTVEVKGASRTPAITLFTQGKAVELKPISGSYYRTAVPFFGFRCFVRYAPDAIQTRINDQSPFLMVSLDDNPHDIFWLVRLKDWKDDDSLVLDLHSPSVYESTESSNEPSKESSIAFNATEEKPGQWRITPKTPFSSGNYGLFRWAKNNSKNSSLYGFKVAGSVAFRPEINDGVKNTTVNSKSRNQDLQQGIILNNGEVIEGEIIKMTADVVKIRTKDGKVLSYDFMRDVKKVIQ